MLNLNTYLIKEHVGFLKLADTYDIFDPNTNQQIGVAKEEPGGFIKFLRFLINKQMLPTSVSIYAQGEDTPLFSIHRGFSFLRAKIKIKDASGEEIGFFKSKIFSLGGGFWVYDKNGEQFAEVKGDWKGWNFKFITPDGQELGQVTKKWAGFAKEMFTSADNYIISINEDAPVKEVGNMLLLAAGLAIDVIYKEH